MDGLAGSFSCSRLDAAVLELFRSRLREWVGDLDGYYREITGRVPLRINESSMSTSD
jgi:hypothetical protein